MEQIVFPGKAALRKTSLVDYPGRVSSVIFFPHCNMRCPWCHNGELILQGATAEGLLPLADVLAYIAKHSKTHSGVVLSGGEPTLYAELPALIATLKTYGLKIKLDTNGLLPEVLRVLFSKPTYSPDYIAMDLKLAPARYAELLAARDTEMNVAERISESAALIRGSGIAHEFRSLKLPEHFYTASDTDALAALAADSTWNFRPFVAGNCLDPSWNEK
jgi:pyruvate formate lyase activating enzyme